MLNELLWHRWTQEWSKDRNINSWPGLCSRLLWSGSVLFFFLILHLCRCLPTYIISPNPQYAIQVYLITWLTSQLHLQARHTPATLNCMHSRAPFTDLQSAAHLLLAGNLSSFPWLLGILQESPQVTSTSERFLASQLPKCAECSKEEKMEDSSTAFPVCSGARFRRSNVTNNEIEHFPYADSHLHFFENLCPCISPIFLLY